MTLDRKEFNPWSFMFSFPEAIEVVVVVVVVVGVSVVSVTVCQRRKEQRNQWNNCSTTKRAKNTASMLLLLLLSSFASRNAAAAATTTCCYNNCCAVLLLQRPAAAGGIRSRYVSLSMYVVVIFVSVFRAIAFMVVVVVVEAVCCYGLSSIRVESAFEIEQSPSYGSSHHHIDAPRNLDMTTMFRSASSISQRLLLLHVLRQRHYRRFRPPARPSSMVFTEWTSVQRHLQDEDTTLQNNNDNGSGSGNGNKMERGRPGIGTSHHCHGNVAGQQCRERPCRGGSGACFGRAENSNNDGDDMTIFPQHVPSIFVRQRGGLRSITVIPDPVSDRQSVTATYAASVGGTR
jgi:hypothetical protein